MGKNQEERKTPVIVVKKRRTFSPPSLSEKTDIIAPVFTEQTAESAPARINSSAVETHIPEAPARKKKKKRHRFPRPSHWTREYTHECVEKIKALFPHLRAEGGGFIPLKIGISNDISAFLAEHPETELTMDEWLCAVSCITSRRVYLQRTAVAGVPRYGLDGHPKGQVSDSEAQSAGRRLATLEQKWLRTQAQQENILSLFKYFVKYFFPLDREDLLKLMDLAKDSPDAKQELLERLLSGKRMTGRDEMDIKRILKTKEALDNIRNFIDKQQLTNSDTPKKSTVPNEDKKGIR